MAKYIGTYRNNLTGESYTIQANDQYTFQNKLNALNARWEKQNSRLIENQEKEKAIKNADIQTKEALSAIEECQNILKYTLNIDDKVDWDDIKQSKILPTKPVLENFMKSVPKKSIFEIFAFQTERREKAEQQARYAFEEELKNWEKLEANRQEYLKEIDELKIKYEKQVPESIEKYISIVLERSKYPSFIDLVSEVVYEPNSRIALIEMNLPNPKSIPSVVEYRYVASKKEIVSKEMKEKDFEKLFDDTLINICLRTVHEVFESDYTNAVDIIVFNGQVEGTDRKTGQKFKNCVISLQTTKEDFSNVNLKEISPRDCFRHLKGITAGSLVTLAPVRPLMILNKDDKRIIAADQIIDEFDANKNLATMDWQEFEVMVRDLLQKEFGNQNCKVEVTQASRDAGVDAIAFDEDPIRGGKYVIQAKRYNNLVPLTAVRDLYGTVMNEGAVKGILVTTSYFGKDALEFAKSKPLTLINGEGLLSMFAKHGYNFKIELQKKKKAVTTETY